MAVQILLHEIPQLRRLVVAAQNVREHLGDVFRGFLGDVFVQLLDESVQKVSPHGKTPPLNSLLVQLELQVGSFGLVCEVKNEPSNHFVDHRVIIAVFEDEVELLHSVDEEVQNGVELALH